MKSLIVIAALFSGLTASAFSQPQCLGEAQIIAKVAGVEKKSMTSCRLFVSDVRFYAESLICPLDLSQVMSEGIEIGMKNGHDCETDATEVSGVLVINKAGVISFDQ